MKKQTKIMTLLSILFITLSCEKNEDLPVQPQLQNPDKAQTSNLSPKDPELEQSQTDEEQVDPQPAVTKPDVPNQKTPSIIVEESPVPLPDVPDRKAPVIIIDEPEEKDPIVIIEEPQEKEPDYSISPDPSFLISTTQGDNFNKAILASDGSMYLVGETLSNLGDNAAGKTDILIMKLKANGKLDENFAVNGIFQYGKSFGDARLIEIVNDLALDDGEESLFVTGFTNSALSGVKPDLLHYDGFVMKINAKSGKLDEDFGDGDGVDNDGIVQLNDKNVNSNKGYDYISSIKFSNGSLFLAGHTTGSLSGKISGKQDGFIMKMNSISGLLEKDFGNGDGMDNDGILQLNSTFIPGANGSDLIRELIVEDKNIYALGSSSGSISGKNSGYEDIFVLKLHNPSGMLDKNFGSGDGKDNDGIMHINSSIVSSAKERDYASDFTLDKLGNLWITGYTNSNFSGQVNGLTDSFIIKMSKVTGKFDEEFGDKDGKDNDGVLLINSKIANSKNTEYAYSITVDNLGYVYISGYTNSLLSGPKVGGINDMFLMKLDSVHGLLEKKNFGNGDGQNKDGIVMLNDTQTINADKSDYCDQVLLDGNGNYYLIGHTSSPLSGHKGGSTDAVIIKGNTDTGSFDQEFGDDDGQDNDGILQINFNAKL